MAVFREYKTKDGKRTAYPRYRAWVRSADGSRRKHVLFTDRKLSERKLRQLQDEADLDAVDGAQAKREREGRRPLQDHFSEYVSWLKSTSASVDHPIVSEGMLRRLAVAASWKLLRDITCESVESALPVVAPKTQSYRNAYIKRVKAFIVWIVQRGRLRENPLLTLRRVSERRAIRNRARRAASWNELHALLSIELPEDRLLSYALASLNGLRRNEVLALRWEDVHLAAVIPFMQVGRKMGQSDSLDALPLHPFVARILERRSLAMPSVRVVRAVPDVKTLKKDLQRAGLTFENDARLRLDFHALRHTFCSLLDHTGASRSTKKRLMRHASEDVTDGYSHAELSDMVAALQRLPDPDEIAVASRLATGTSDAVATMSVVSKSDQGQTTLARNGALACMMGNSPIDVVDIKIHSENQGDCALVQGCAGVNLNRSANRDIVVFSGPGTQVD